MDLDEVMFSKHVPDHEGWPTLEPAMAYVVEELMQKCGFSKDDVLMVSRSKTIAANFECTNHEKTN